MLYKCSLSVKLNFIDSWKWDSYSHKFVDYKGELAQPWITAMVDFFLLLQEWAGALKAVLLEAGMFWGLASTVSLSAETGKNEKGLPLNPKKQKVHQKACASYCPCWAIWQHI